MLTSIAFMIGFYILLRCFSFLTRKGERAESAIVKVFSAITIFVTIIILINLVVSGFTSAPFRS